VSVAANPQKVRFPSVMQASHSRQKPISPPQGRSPRAQVIVREPEPPSDVATAQAPQNVREPRIVLPPPTDQIALMPPSVPTVRIGHRSLSVPKPVTARIRRSVPKLRIDQAMIGPTVPAQVIRERIAQIGRVLIDQTLAVAVTLLANVPLKVSGPSRVPQGLAREQDSLGPLQVETSPRKPRTRRTKRTIRTRKTANSAL
jgi:hypothetical protein